MKKQILTRPISREYKCRCGPDAVLEKVKKIVFENGHVGFKLCCERCGGFYAWPHRRIVEASAIEVVE